MQKATNINRKAYIKLDGFINKKNLCPMTKGETQWEILLEFEGNGEEKGRKKQTRILVKTVKLKHDCH